MELVGVVAGGVLLALICREDLAWLQRFIALSAPVGVVRVTRRLVTLAATLLAVRLIADPFVVGSASVMIRAPVTVPTVTENLRARLTPVSLISGLKTVDEMIVAVANDGTARATMKFRALETRVRIELFDVTQPASIVCSNEVHVSALARRQITQVNVVF